MNNRLINWCLFILLCSIWGSSFILMKVSQKGLLAEQIAAVRIFAAGIVFLPFAIFHITKLPRRKIALIILIGVFGNLLPAFCFAIAILKINSSLAGILNSLTPICVAIIAIGFFKDKIRLQKITGILVGFAGLCILTLTQNKSGVGFSPYALLIFAATLMYGINVNLVGHYLKNINPIHLATVSLAFMTIPSAIVLWRLDFFQLDFTDSVTKWSVFNAILLGIVASAFATVIFYMLVQRAGGLFASLVTYGVPFVALFWGFLDGESITFVEIICLCLILFGVYLANRPDKKEDGPLVSGPPGKIDLEKN